MTGFLIRRPDVLGNDGRLVRDVVEVRHRAVLEVNTTWSDPSEVTLESTDQTAFRSRAGYFFNRLKVNTTSVALNGCPSDHLTP